MTDLLPLVGANAAGFLSLLVLLWYRTAAAEKGLAALSVKLDKSDEKLLALAVKLEASNGHDISRLETRVDEIGRNVHSLVNSMTVFMGNVALEREKDRNKT